VQDITHVVNFQCPDDEKTYLHRIGRTARAGASGVAITFVDWDDLPRWSLIDKALDLGFGEPEETYSNSDHLYEELEIPRHVTGVLPRAQRTRAGLDAEKVEDIGETGKVGRGPVRSGTGGRSGGGDRGGSDRGGGDRGSGDRGGRGRSGDGGGRDGGSRGGERGGRSRPSRDGAVADAPAGGGATSGSSTGGDKPRRKRSRTRTRGGRPADGAGPSGS
jgi:superfamily II DNA/RNA helicase